MMWPIPLPSLSTKFYWTVIALLTFALTVSQLHGRALKAENETLETKLQLLTDSARTYAAHSKTIAKETSDAFTTLVEQIKSKSTALKNAQKRFGGNLPICDGPIRLPTPYGDGETRIPESTGGIQQPELVVIDEATLEGCATDHAFVNAVQDWRKLNALPVK